MHYGAVLPGSFIARPNRFVARVELEGKEEICHVKIQDVAGNCCSPVHGSGAGSTVTRIERPIMI